MLRMSLGTLRERIERSSTGLIALAFALSGLMPIILTAQASAGTLGSRSVTISSSQAATSANYAFRFTPTVTNQDIESIIFQFCNTPLGTCVLPGEVVAGTNNGTGDGTELDVTTSTLPGSHFDGTTDDGFAKVTSDTGQCTDADGASQIPTMICVQRTQTTDEDNTPKTFTINSILNPTIPTGNNQQVYVRITTYFDNDFNAAEIVDQGTVAAAIVNQLTVTGRVQERLVFCVYALTDAAGSNATVGTGAGELPTSCSATEANAGTNVDIGVVDNTSISYSPEDNAPPSSMGNDRFGVMQVNTNASLGVTLAYYATSGSGTNEQRAFRVSGATCDVSGTSLVDQCFISAANASEAFTAGTERFGMQLACVTNNATAGSTLGTTSNLGKTAGTYTFNDGTGGTINTAYDAGRTVTFDDVSDDCENDPSGTTLSDEFAWNDSGTAEALISSDTVVDDEMVKLRFGATASATTPTGNYTVASTYIATPVFQTF